MYILFKIYLSGNKCELYEIIYDIKWDIYIKIIVRDFIFS